MGDPRRENIEEVMREAANSLATLVHIMQRQEGKLNDLALDIQKMREAAVEQVPGGGHTRFKVFSVSHTGR